MAKREHIIIIGGGFSGTALAIALAQADADVTVIDPRSAPGYGVAYSTTEPAHRINVPAERMQLSGESQGDFDRWFRTGDELNADPHALWHDGKVYPQRGAFGRYVEQRFHEASHSGRATLRHLADSVINIQPDAQGATVTTQGGKTLYGSYVVLAVSHPAPALPRQIPAALVSHPALIGNPWQANALDNIAADEPLAIIGTGLTMADVVAALHRRGHRGQITAFSRHGLLPRSNLVGDYPAWNVPDVGFTSGKWLRQIRLEIARAAQLQQPWQVVLDDIRSSGQRIWQALSEIEQRRFLRHLRAYWDVHRYRIAPQVSTLLEQKRADGSLRVIAARLQQAEQHGSGLALTILPRHASQESWQVQRLIVTTGPAHAGLIESNPALNALAEQGALRADALGLGLAVNEHSEVLDNLGRANPRLLVAGPAARGRFGELMGLPQVADHAQAVAGRILSALAERCRHSH